MCTMNSFSTLSAFTCRIPPDKAQGKCANSYNLDELSHQKEFPLEEKKTTMYTKILFLITSLSSKLLESLGMSG